MGLKAIQQAADYGAALVATVKTIKSEANKAASEDSAHAVPFSSENVKIMEVLWSAVEAPSSEEVCKASGGVFDDATCVEAIDAIRAAAVRRFVLTWLDGRLPPNDA